MADAEQKPPQNQEPEGFSEEEKALFEKLNIGKEGGMPMPDFIKPSEVRSRTAGLAASIFKAYHSLQHIVGEHEATLARRWAGIKQKKKRKELLLAAAKAIEVAGESWKVPEGHRPDIDIWRDVREGGSDEKLFAAKDAARRAAFLWPHLNLEDLSRPEPLVLMLASRARNAPDAFAAADLERARFAMESLALMPHYLNRYTMMFDKRTKPEEYGELVAWEDLPEDSDKKWLFERRGIHPGEGLWLLEVQDVTYRFLLEACKKILHDIPEDQLLANGDAKTPTAQAVEPTTAAEFSALITKIAEEPYRSPAGLDRTQLLEPVQARLQEAKDHLQALREDPAYFEAVLNDWATHRREQLVDANGNPHPILAKSPQVFWGRVVNRVVNSALLDVVEWGVVLSKVKTLLALLDEHEPTLDEGKDLPAELAFAFYALDHHVEQLKAGPFANITMGLVASPPMRPYFQLVTPESAEDKTLSIAAVEEAPAEESTRLLIRRLGVVQDEKQRQLVGLPAALDELEYLLTSQHPEAKAKITPWVAAQLSSLSVYSRLLRQVELFQPWAARFGADVQDKGVREALDGDFRRSVQAANVPKVTAYEVNERLIGMAMPGKNKFSYPLENVIAPGNADQIRRAEVNLDGFWGRVKVELERSGAMTGALKDVFAKPLRRLGGPAAEAAALSGRSGKVGKQANGGVGANGEAMEDWEIYAAEMAAKEAAQTQKKAAAAAAATSNGTSKNGATPKKVNTDKRSLKVFKSLFHDPLANPGSKPAEVSWPEFVHAMHTAGFSVVKLYGSAWLFIPSAEVGGSPLMVQEPYTASSKMSPTAARIVGRRLAWNYGWDRGSFEQ
ncbi:uncharacterized protein PgNI_05094 [Pyricularia grisea]|uniref:Uncharacterized protein n=1 Tax=Pyricularia grisea TaxID=148305 RepID=A0A6P8BC34_PYRGI|nr:uncharacterized protein PgNI_05094 [Pyricularia grisea]TLD13416.1 hypothetical protein PgNI_05094 [Pyricularia grisea]